MSLGWVRVGGDGLTRAQGGVWTRDWTRRMRRKMRQPFIWAGGTDFSLHQQQQQQQCWHGIAPSPPNHAAGDASRRPEEPPHSERTRAPRHHLLPPAGRPLRAMWSCAARPRWRRPSSKGAGGPLRGLSWTASRALWWWASVRLRWHWRWWKPHPLTNTRRDGCARELWPCTCGAWLRRLSVLCCALLCGACVVRRGQAGRTRRTGRR